MKVKVLVTGVFREITSANGKRHIFSEIWVSLPNMPYPVQIDHYGPIDLSPAEYEVPVLFNVRDRRLSIQFNFAQAVQIKGAA